MFEKRATTSRESSNERVPKKPRKGLESLIRTVSPPPASPRRDGKSNNKSIAALVEAGEVDLQDHLAFYSSHLLPAIQPVIPGQPRLPHKGWVELYKRNAQSVLGSHFVIHQHDHPVAGTHYDLRLQCNPTSSISFAIMYGLPGDPNSRRLNRNATETRVHCLWNHLIETASYSTGSMLIWDTGEYEILPYREIESGNATDDGLKSEQLHAESTEQSKLRIAFRSRKIKLRLHGARLPSGYTLSLRLTKDNNRDEQPGKPARRRKRKDPGLNAALQKNDSDLDASPGHVEVARREHSPRPRHPLGPATSQEAESRSLGPENNFAAASDNEEEMIRANNAYIGAVNDIGSVHQRKWYLSIDRKASGFAKAVVPSASGFIDTRWDRTTEEKLASGLLLGPSGFERFVVGGRETERSVVTGRLAADILRDENVVGFVPRGLWRPVTE